MLLLGWVWGDKDEGVDMSTDIAVIANTGTDGNELVFTSFGGSKGATIQLTQGFGGAAGMAPIDRDEVGHIQLTVLDAYKTIKVLADWIKQTTERRAIKLQEEIDKNAELKETIFMDAVKCQRFIKDLKVLEVPLQLLK
jgi:hypothetical protein